MTALPATLTGPNAIVGPKLVNRPTDDAAPQPAAQPGVEMAKALAAARDRCGAAPRDGTNEHHNYRYSSAESILTTAKAALAGSGLSVVPLGHTLRVLGSGPTACHEVVRRLLLVHTSGESVHHELPWPVIPERGRPLDKALAIALTASLAYYLRDLLMMTRVAPDEDMAAREDRPTAAAAQSPTAAEANWKKLSARLTEIASLAGTTAEQEGEALWKYLEIGDTVALEDMARETWQQAFKAAAQKLKALKQRAAKAAATAQQAAPEAPPG